MSVIVPSPIAGIFAPLASTKFMACFPHSEVPARARKSRGQKAQSRSRQKRGRLLDAPPSRGGYGMPRFRGAVTGCPAFAGQGNRIFGGGRFSAPASLRKD